jgi:hypothetical protein
LAANAKPIEDFPKGAPGPAAAHIRPDWRDEPRDGEKEEGQSPKASGREDK